MCTAATYLNGDFYFGRTLDLEYSYHETVTVTPRNFPFRFRRVAPLTSHLALIGMAYVTDGYPLYYEATNEKGLSMAGLNFPGYACFHPAAPDKDNLAPFEFIPWILGQCATLDQARELLTRVNLMNEDFSPELPAAQLHWILSGREGSLTVESLEDGLHVYDNPVGVLTNNPPFDYQMTNLANYMTLSTKPPVNQLCKRLPLEPYSRGMGALGLPGDLSSVSRFVKVAFTKLNSCSGTSESENISQFFHILGSVDQQRGCVYMGDGKYEVTIYTSCCNTDKGIYYYTSYENSQITGVDMHHEDLDGGGLVSYPMLCGQHVMMQN